jgi:DNA (cytosine-5)-methyltransferase 1
MKYLSVCSGIEAATVAWHGLGWTPLAFSEIEPFPRAVLQHHYPDVPLHGDFTVLRDQPWIVDADILVGGTPCQAFSVAGLRNSLSDERGNFSLEFVRLADAIDNVRIGSGRKPAIIVWENVPGVLSVKDNAFGCFLSALAGDDTPYVPPRGKWTNAGVVAGPKRTIAWRVLDAQYFGLAQRRRRVFVVASAGDGFDPAAVLLECEGVRRDTPPRRETGQAASGGAGTGSTVGFQSSQSGVRLVDTHATLDANNGPRRHNGVLVKKDAALSHWDGGVIKAVDVCPTLRAGGNSTGGDRPPGTAVDTADSLIVTHSLRAEGFDASEDGTGRGTAELGGGDKPHVLAFHENQRAEITLNDTAGSLKVGGGKPGQGYPAVMAHMAVRRLTPVECERLQGFPDGYTNIPWRGKPEAPDGPRYKALGNSMAVPCMRWIGERIQNAS